jgi:hypothetical protein
MMKSMLKVLAGVAVLAAIAVGAAAVAGAASGNGSSTSSGTGSGWARGGMPPGGHGPGETLLTGDTADKVRKAAQDKVPGGTILRVETDSDGSPYEAHVRKSDGSQVVVKVDRSFHVTAVQDFPGPGRMGMSGHSSRGPSGTGAATGPPSMSLY